MSLSKKLILVTHMVFIENKNTIANINFELLRYVKIPETGMGLKIGAYTDKTNYR